MGHYKVEIEAGNIMKKYLYSSSFTDHFEICINYTNNNNTICHKVYYIEKNGYRNEKLKFRAELDILARIKL